MEKKFKRSDTETEEQENEHSLEEEEEEEEEELALSQKKQFMVYFSQDSLVRCQLFQENKLELQGKDLKNKLRYLWKIPIDYQDLRLSDGQTEVQIVDSKSIKECGVEAHEEIDSTNKNLIELRIVTPPGQEPLDISAEYLDEEETFLPTSYYNLSQNINDDDDLLDNMERPPSGLVGLKNLGATCYLNSLIQVLYLTPEFRRMIYHISLPYHELIGDDKENMGRRKDNIIFQMQLLFAKMQCANISSASTNGLTTSFGWTNSDIFTQHDVQELNRVLCDKLEEQMKDKISDKYDSIATLYKGVMVNMIKCTNCGRISSRDEDFYDISLAIRKKKNIFESLEEFTQEEILEGSNAYHCEKCNAKHRAEKSTKFKTLPKILNLQLKRFEYDFRRDTSLKLNDEIEFPMILDMRSYLVDIPNEEKPSTNGNSQISPFYELVGIFVHSGSALFGHYYAFIKNLTDGQWYKFNDEQVTQVEEEDVKSQNWHSKKHSWYSSSSFYRSANPYMLVYRRTNVTPDIIEENSEDVVSKRFSENDASTSSPVQDNEIPEPILEYLNQDIKNQEEKKKKLEYQQSICSIYVYRNRLELPKKTVKISQKATLGQLYEEIVKTVKSESETPLHYRLRRIATRKNNTRRPMQIYPEKDFEKKISDIGLLSKPYIYLEQSSQEDFGGVGDISDTQVLILIRYWDEALEQPTTVGDFVFPKITTLFDVKNALIEKNLIDAKPEEIFFVEEETESIFNPMTEDTKTLSSYGIISGDILHIEKTSPWHKNRDGKIYRFKTEDYYKERSNEMKILVEESLQAYKKRVPSAEKTSTEESYSTATLDESDQEFYSDDENNRDYHQNRIEIKVFMDYTEPLKLLRKLVGMKIDKDPRFLRFYSKTFSSRYPSTLLKDSTLPVKDLVDRRDKLRFLYTILEEPEELTKDDELINVHCFNSEHVLIGTHEIKLNKKMTVQDIKKEVEKKTSIAPQYQIISEWKKEQYPHFNIIDNAQKSIEDLIFERVQLENIRMDALERPLSETKNYKVLQVVQYLSWNTFAHRSREMKTTQPIPIVVFEEDTLFDLREKIAKEEKVSCHNINFAFVETFPITEILGIGKIVEICINDESFDLKDEEDEKFAQLKASAQSENRDGKTWKFHIEAQIKALDFLEKFHKNFIAISWENMSTSKQSKASSTSKKRDTAVLRIQ